MAAQYEIKMDEIMQKVRNTGEEYVVLADFNAEAAEWGSPITDTRGRILTDWLGTIDLVVLNTGLEPTFVRRGTGTHNDVIMATQGIAAKARSWKVLPDYTETKHRYIGFSITPGYGPLTQSMRSGRRRVDAAMGMTKKYTRSCLNGHNLRALEALEQPVEHWDGLLKYILLEKLDSESVKEWEKANNVKVSQVSDLIYFLKTKADTLERYNLNKPNIQGISVNNHVKFRDNSTKALVSTKSSFLSCPLCNQQHKLVHCSQFHSLDIPARINKVRRFKLCLNCLHSGHQQATCKYGECKKCNQKHHTLLHEFIENPLNPLSQFNDQVVASQSSPQTLSNTSQNQQILLSAVVVQVRDHLGVAHNCRALLDSGAQSNFITSSLVDLLGISREQQTRLGWIISGPLINTRVHSQQSTICGLSHNIETDGLSRFWEIEECSGTKLQSSEELLCEEQFKSIFRRNLDGRFIVSIPFKLQVDSLGESRSIAQRRFYILEKRLLNDPIMNEQYVAFMEEYLSLGHMSRVTDCTLPVHSYYFQDSLTTKLRVVFDGSCPSSSGHSLNELQMVGPVMQNDLISILLRFRRYLFVASADIAKMYRQILIDDTKRCLQRILWRNHPKDPLHSYELNTVTYGSTSSSYLATRCLYQLSLEHSDTFPQASKSIAEDFYVDDLLTGSDSLEDLILNCKQVSKILSKGCFPLRKWTSNNSSFLKSIQESISLDTPFLFGANENTKTLGLQWCPSLDLLSYSIDSNLTPKIITKRSILSGIAQIFDPLGLLSPSIIKVKILMQLLWLEKLDWDEGVPLHIQSEWLSFRDQLHELNKLQIQRNVVLPNSVLIEMHGFCDASEVAYGTAIYIRSVDEKGNIFINLLCAKSKVAPVKKLSVPRLELSGALILSRLSKMVTTSLNIQFNKIFLWSDSTITLGWIKTSLHVLKTFVGNRVSEIQSNTDPENWRHVPTDCNPADLLSRGIEPQVLSSCSFWWHGPSFLLDSPETWPVQVSFDKEKLPEFKTISNQFMIVSSTPFFDFKKYSSFSTLVRSVAYSLRFYYNSQRKNNATRVLGHLTTQEINMSTLTLVKLVQAEGFPSKIQCLRRGNAVSYKSRILSLNPFLDPEGLLRVGGRLSNSNFSYQKKHPILIQSNHKFTLLFFHQEHFKLCHAGPQHLLAHVREKYWPLHGKSLARRKVRECLRCCRFNPDQVNSIMGDLRQSRVTPSFPFAVTGVDYAGPFALRTSRHRGASSYKGYISLFVCLSTKAIHLEVVTDLSTETFMATIKRFIARRGKPCQMMSDNGTTFVGANNSLLELGKFLKTNGNKFPDMCAKSDINWKFIPAHSPHFGGLWEAGVKSVKTNLKRVMTDTKLDYERFVTLLTQIEGVLNSRHLSALSSNTSDLLPLTPAHFLIGRAMDSVPEINLSNSSITSLSRFQQLQQLRHHFWKRWSLQYISELQERKKWKVNQSKIQTDTLVLIKERNLPTLNWCLGRVELLHPGADGVTRVVTIRTSKGLIKRAVTNICSLPVPSDQSEGAITP
ncbi:uncharacterized protein [Diabrotica undecimpunctata]|uniref:uncharacterized protein n=1 Tax=Diabrotica undecimpunctata TaxID=50387 RepID=UPI003B64015E